ncbi:MAG: hypothetical protein QXJ93_01855 [Candidatus Rehaiarchaeum fermentans]|nr:hypothetical protein [Candidatus Rehaiarchaeum fermentans]
MIEFAGLLFVYFISLNNSLSENQFLYFFINSSLNNYNYTISLIGPSIFHFSGEGHRSILGKVNISNVLFGKYNVSLNITGVNYSINGGSLYIRPEENLQVIGCGNVYLFGNKSSFNVTLIDNGNTPLEIYIPDYNSSSIYPLFPNKELVLNLEKGISNITIYYAFENYTFSKVCEFSYPSTKFSLKVLHIFNIKNTTGNYYIFEIFYNGSISTKLNISGLIYSYGSYFNYTNSTIVNKSGNYTVKLPSQISFSNLKLSYLNSSDKYEFINSSFNPYNSNSVNIYPNTLYYVIVLLIVIVLLFLLHKLLWKKK